MARRAPLDMSRRDWLAMMARKGATASIAQTPPAFDRRAFNRMNGDEQAAYDRRPSRTTYRLTLGATFWNITKAEYDHFITIATHVKESS